MAIFNSYVKLPEGKILRWLKHETNGDIPIYPLDPSGITEHSNYENHWFAFLFTNKNIFHCQDYQGVFSRNLNYVGSKLLTAPIEDCSPTLTIHCRPIWYSTIIFEACTMDCRPCPCIYIYIHTYMYKCQHTNSIPNLKWSQLMF